MGDLRVRGPSKISVDLLKQDTSSPDMHSEKGYGSVKFLKEKGFFSTRERLKAEFWGKIWAEQLVEMYTKWAGKHGCHGRIVEKCPSKSGGVKSAIIEFESKYAYGYFPGEIGIHRMISSRKESVFPEGSMAAVGGILLFLEAGPDLFIDGEDLDISSVLSCEVEKG